MRIVFIHPHKSFLPEIQAYRNFFSGYGIETVICRPDEYSEINADVEWHFLGMHTTNSKKKPVIIHEYASASLPPFRKEKDFLKRWTNTKPDYRLFLNEYVKKQLGFKDNVPFGFREMGIADSFFSTDKEITKSHDFIYTGSVTANRQIEKLLTLFTNSHLKKHSLLILSSNYENLMDRFSSSENITFLGPVEHGKVSEYVSKSRFAINYMPDKEPFNHQTPVKLLEYIALKIPVISSRYAWVEEFSQSYGGNFFYLDNEDSNLTWENVTRHQFSFPDVEEWRWERQIRKSGVLEFLQSRFHELSF